jgi:hypothetical protein
VDLVRDGSSERHGKLASGKRRRLTTAVPQYGEPVLRDFRNEDFGGSAAAAKDECRRNDSGVRMVRSTSV